MTAIDDLNATLDAHRAAVQVANGAAPATAHELIIMRNQVNALVTLLAEAGVVSTQQFSDALTRQIGYDASALLLSENALPAALGLIGAGPAGRLVPPQGIIALPLALARKMDGDWTGADTYNLAATGGLLAKDSTPILEGSASLITQQLEINWAGGDTATVGWSIPRPVDCDSSKPITVNFRARLGMAGADIPALHVGFYENSGDNNIGGDTATLSTVERVVSVSVTVDVLGPWLILVTPDTHATTAIELYEVWIEYTKTSERA